MEYNRAQLKRSVKLSMRSTTSRPMVTALLFSIAVSAGTWLINTVLGGLLTGGVGSISDSLVYNIQQGHDMEEAMYITMLELFRRGPGALFGAIVGGSVLSILVTLWQSSMDVGYESWCLSMVRNENPPMNQIFSALPQFGSVLLTRFLTGVFEVLWTLPVAAVYAVILVIAAVIDMPVVTVLLIFLDIVLLILGIIWVTMRYTLVDYVLLDQGLSGLDAIRESKRLMQGRIKDGFLLKLSFCGWFLLEAVIAYAGIFAAIGLVFSAFGNGGELAGAGLAMIVILGMFIAITLLSLWLKPYTTGSMARFYDWAMGRPVGFTGGGFSGPGGGQGGWSGPHDYTWTSGPTSGTGTGRGPSMGGSGGSSTPRSPKPPRDDPWE